MCSLVLADLIRDQQCIPDLVMARDYGPEGMTAKTALDAVNLAEVMAANRPRLTVRLALVAGLLSLGNLMEPEETTE